MNKEEFFTLAGRYNDGLCSQEEKDIVESFCDNVQVDSISSQWSLTEEEKLRVRLLKRITLSIEEFEAVDENRKSILKQYVGFVWKSAAVIILAIGVGYGFYSLNQGTEKTENMPMVVHQTVKSNTKGVKSHIKLPDGSSVWLNASSTISYNPGFSDTARLVELRGEAYFEVKKDSRRPFRVTSGRLVTTALGTSFNIHAYEEHPVRVSLSTGKVGVARNDSKEHVVLEPGQQATGGALGLSVGTFDNRVVLSWKEGTIYFDNTGFDEVVRVLERWYDVDISVENLSDKDRKVLKITGTYTDQPLENVLKAIGHSMKFKFTINRKQVTIKF